jgi:4-amino-4-deoxy-L-arabinose transferase-like glycosyltransferase
MSPAGAESPRLSEAWTLLALGALAIAVRVAAALVLKQPLDSDPLAYFTMAQGLAERGELLDQHGQHAFYSAGYPLLLTPFFELFGASVTVALAVNMALAVVSLWLVYRLTLDISRHRLAALLASLAYALWLPAIWNATMLAKENLTTPLLLAVTLCALHIVRGRTRLRLGAAAGLLWGAALITGGSSLLLCGAVGTALLVAWRRGGRFAPAFRTGAAFVLGALVALAPWLYATDRMVGRPLLTTNAAFNLYLGANPVATGRFVSIADTPMGPHWEATRARLGEAATADLLQAEALRWMHAHPAQTAALAVRKLVYFWQPNLPDAQDFQASKAVAAIHLAEAVQYAAILLVGLLAFGSRRIDTVSKLILGAAIVGFWLIHAAAYVVFRYRDPAVPLLLAMAAAPVAAWLESMPRPRWRREVIA